MKSIVPLLLGTLCMLAAAGEWARASTTWLGGVNPFIRAFRHQPPNDYMNLFTNGPGWTRDVTVFELTMPFIRHASDADLHTIVDFINRNHMQLALSGLMLNWTPACGRGIEGYDSPNGIESDARRIQSMGGHFSYLIMDEPLIFGSLSEGGNYCHTPIPALAAQIAPRIQHLLQMFPDLKIGDDEPLPCQNGTPCLQALPAWFAAYRAATGRNLDFFHADVQFDDPNWPNQVRAARALTNQIHARFGVIIIGSGTAPDDRAWTASALQRWRRVCDVLGGPPEDIPVESWQLRPMMLLPPNEPGTLTYVAGQIARELR